MKRDWEPVGGYLGVDVPLGCRGDPGSMEKVERQLDIVHLREKHGAEDGISEVMMTKANWAYFRSSCRAGTHLVDI